MIWIYIISAAILNALMDIMENENFFSSRLSKLNQKFWYKRESWKHAKKVFGWKFDSWHVAKSLMVMVLLWAAAESVIQWLILGAIWNITFSITYKFLKK
jgi:hypothetical protein